MYKLLSSSIKKALFIFSIIMVLVLSRIFVFEIYKVPSTSMVPSLIINDKVYVDKISYGVNIPIFNIKLPATVKIDRGVPIAFNYPHFVSPGILVELINILSLGVFKLTNSEDNPQIFVKRIIGLPGDLILFKNNQEYSIKPHLGKSFVIKINDKLFGENSIYTKRLFIDKLKTIKQPMDSNIKIFRKSVFEHLINKIKQHSILSDIEYNKLISSYELVHMNDSNILPYYKIKFSSVYDKELYNIFLKISYPKFFYKKHKGIYIDHDKQFKVYLYTIKQDGGFNKSFLVQKFIGDTEESKDSYNNSYSIADYFRYSANYYSEEFDNNYLYIPRKNDIIDIIVDINQNIKFYVNGKVMFSTSDSKTFHNIYNIFYKDILIKTSNKNICDDISSLCFRYSVKDNYYYVRGDNRYMSSDSMIWGFVPYSNILGKPSFIVWPFKRIGFIE